MISSHANDLSISFVAWINVELRHEIERREETVKTPRFTTRVKSLIAAGLSGISLTLVRLLQD